MSGCFKNMLMGPANRYYLEMIKDIYDVAGSNEFEWREIFEKHEYIGRSELSKLKCSNFIVKVKDKKYKTGYGWKMHSDAISMLKEKKLI